jgi:microcin C transport system substrate-binding protein
LALGAGAAATLVCRRTHAKTLAQDGERHGMSGFGDLKYPADFKHFEYVNPSAPRAAVLADRFDPPVQSELPHLQLAQQLHLRGDAALGMELTFATLMKPAGDEPDAMYGLAARAVRISSDG